MPDSILNTRCAIVGGGPGGMMLGFLLARAGVNVVVLEKFPDFLRDFRGDTIHPSTMEILKDLGLLEEFLKLPHETLQKIKMQFDDLILTLADFSYLKTSIKCIAFMPQWDFLNFIASRAEQFNNFQLMMQTEVTDIIEKNGRVIGVQAISPEGSLTIYSDLVIGADGRHSTVKEKLGLISIDDGAPMDVLWFRVHKIINDPATPLIRFSQGRGLVLISRGDYWQCGYIIPKDGWTQIKNRELSGFQEEISEKAPFMQDRIKELKWDQIKLLSVEVSHLKQWCRPGVLCIGDAAHATGHRKSEQIF